MSEDIILKVGDIEMTVEEYEKYVDSLSTNELIREIKETLDMERKKNGQA